uniref:DNA/RNA-binding protein Kin17 WH-like domain-containing protein n=1 Tax=Lotharella globosa TaxID=91324 RepID=A0A7S3YPR8_9EUKA
MCNKQCRDENGFKCHTMSESHARQMRLFRENSGKYMSYYSDMFKKGFMEVARRRARNRVKANVVYQEYIKDRHHIHMNSTCWETLSSLVVYLSKNGMVDADKTEKGWYIKWKDTDPERMARRAAAERLDKMKMTADAVAERQIQEQVARAHKLAGTDKDGGDVEEDKKELKRDEKRGELKMNIAARKPIERNVTIGSTAVFDNAKATGKKRKKMQQKKSALEELMEEQEREKKRKKDAKRKRPKDVRKENWLFKGLVVKCINKRVGGGAYYKKKGVVKRIHNKFEGEVKMNDSGDVLRLDQEHLETVIPGIGKPVLVLNGGFRGYEAELLSLDDDPKKDEPTVTVKIAAGEWEGEVVKDVALEDVCKLK